MFDRLFDRPVIILAAPRSGSTLLFETLAQAEALWTIGGESHVLIEGIAALNPQAGKVDSNRLTAEHATPRIATAIRQRFALGLRNRDGTRLLSAEQTRVRLLEKTPKNALRQPFLDVIFPDARYIWLTRDPRENIASMMEAWLAGRWVTYRRLPGWKGKWSLLLPPGWREAADAPLVEKCTFQWCAANRIIRDDLAGLARDHWLRVDYRELVREPLSVCRRLAAFVGIDIDPHWQTYLERPLPRSRYTLDRPRTDKWRKHEAAIMSQQSQWQPLWQSIAPPEGG